MRILINRINSFYVISISIFIILTSYTQKPNSRCNLKSILKADSISRVSILSVGDAMAHMPQVKSAWCDSTTDSFDFYPVFQYIAPLLKATDLRIVNFETTLAGKPYSGYPSFCAPDTFAYTLNKVGFNLFVNANNHAADKSLNGIINTIDKLDSRSIAHTGTFKNAEEREKNYPLIVNIKGIKISVLNYSYSTNGIPVPKPGIVNIIDTNIIKSDLAKARESSPDAIIACMHWGIEDQREPNFEQKEIANFLLKNGVDVIIGSHPHVIQPIEVRETNFNGKVKKNLIIWSLGNFIANQRKPYANGGLMVKFDLVKNFAMHSTYVDNILYMPFWVYKAENPIKYYVLPIYQFENDSTTLKMTIEHKKDFEKFISDSRKHLSRDTANIKEFKGF